MLWNVQKKERCFTRWMGATLILKYLVWKKSIKFKLHTKSASCQKRKYRRHFAYGKIMPVSFYQIRDFVAQQASGWCVHSSPDGTELKSLPCGLNRFVDICLQRFTVYSFICIFTFGGSKDAPPSPLSPISFIFMQFSAKSFQIIGFWPKLRNPLGNHGSATVYVSQFVSWLQPRG